MRADSLIESVKLGLWLKTGCERVLALLHIAHCLEPSFRKTPGDVAQLGERSIRIAEVDGSIPFISTNNINLLRRPSCRRFCFRYHISSNGDVSSLLLDLLCSCCRLRLQHVSLSPYLNRTRPCFGWIVTAKVHPNPIAPHRSR